VEVLAVLLEYVVLFLVMVWFTYLESHKLMLEELARSSRMAKVQVLRWWGILSLSLMLRL